MKLPRSTPVRLIGAFIVVSLLAWGLFLGGFWAAMAPSPQTPDLARQSLPTRTVAEAPPEPAQGEIDASGIVTDESGTPQPNVTIAWASDQSSGAATVQATTSEDGRFSLQLPAPGFIATDVLSVPDRIWVAESASNLTFQVAALCPVVVAVKDPTGASIVDQTVRSSIRVRGRASPLSQQAQTDSDGNAHFNALPCGIAEFWVRRAGFPQGARSGIDALVEQRIEIQLVDGVQVEGNVRDIDGIPIAGARVSANRASDETDADGHYGLMVDPSKLSRVSASAEGFVSASERLRVSVDDPDEAYILDFVLESAREVQVYCAGMPENSCDTIRPLMCTQPWSPLGRMCTEQPTTCICPDGLAAIRGGGIAVEVRPDDTEVWLDLRGRGAISGRVWSGGRPTECSAIATRMPTALEDIPGGMSAGGMSACDRDGRFVLNGLKDGNYILQIRSAGNHHDVPSIPVHGSLVDVGDIRLGEGGKISGVVVHGTTGDGVPGVEVVAYKGTDKDLTGIGQTTSGTEGKFTITGLSDGDYSVLLATRPFSPITVHVEDGESAEVELETGDASLLADNGFSLETDEQGHLVVATVNEDGPAAAQGLLPGDVVRGVTLGGVNPADYLPELQNDITDGILDHWGGPGVGLVVERDGAQVEIPLD